MWALSKFRDAFKAEVGDQIAELTRDAAIDRWVNEGQGRLLYYRQKSQAVTWAAGDAFAALPADFHHLERVDARAGYYVPSFDAWGGQLRFREAAAAGGTADLLYWATWPPISGGTPSSLPELGDQACLSFALYRFFKRLASSRADYRMYASIAQSNGVSVQDLAAVGEQHYNDFIETRDALNATVAEPAFYYG